MKRKGINNLHIIYNIIYPFAKKKKKIKRKKEEETITNTCHANELIKCKMKITAMHNFITDFYHKLCVIRLHA